MAERNMATIIERYPREARKFVLIQIATGDERDIPGLLHYRLEALLPHGLEGIHYYYARIPGSDRFLITLLRTTEGIVDSPRDRLPVALSIGQRRDVSIVWDAGKDRILARYMGGRLSQIEEIAPDCSLSDLAYDEVRPSPNNGPCVQSSTTPRSRIVRIIVLALAIMLAIQVVFMGWSALALRQRELTDLKAALSQIRRAGSPEASPASAQAADDAMAVAADDIQQDLASLWLPGFYLTRWRLSENAFSIEGWGYGALRLLAALKKAPSIHNLKLVAIKSADGIDYFTFAGELRDD